MQSAAVNYEHQPLSVAPRIFDEASEEGFRFLSSAPVQVEMRLHREITRPELAQSFAVEAWNRAFDVFVRVAQLDRSLALDQGVEFGQGLGVAIGHSAQVDLGWR